MKRPLYKTGDPVYDIQRKEDCIIAAVCYADKDFKYMVVSKKTGRVSFVEEEKIAYDLY